VIVCSIENLDPMGVHTGDSVTVAPQMTLSDEAYQELRDASVKIIRAVGVETGGSNIQFARSRETGEIRVIEMNPRVSRSSALASKATGYPIAKVAAKLAVGYTLDEIPNDLTKTTPASFEPTLDYVVVKFPRFAFEKFPGADATLGTQMKSVGEAMGIGRTVHRGVPQGLRLARARSRLGDALGDLRRHPRRAFIPGSRSSSPTRAASWRPSTSSAPSGPAGATTRSARRGGRAATTCAGRATPRGIRPSYRRVDSCAGEVDAGSNYYYSTWGEEDEALPPITKPRVVIIGSGPNRIGQGIEFDYCCVHAVQTFRALGYEAVMINCNPETVSTDYDTSDRLYFEPLSPEEVLAVLDREQPEASSPSSAARRRCGSRATSRRPATTSWARRSRRSTSRGPRAVRRPRRRARHPLPALGHRRRRRRGARRRCRDRLSGARPSVLRARRPGDARSVTTTGSCGRRWRRLGSGPRRPLRRERGRDRRRRALRR
jgi:carbamoyl-phosphate synthase large subunit